MLQLSKSSSSSTEEQLDGAPETENPKPSSNIKKMLRRLARQKQLEDVHTREATLAREVRLKRRQGLLLTPPKKANERCVMWKEEAVSFRSLSLCSPRGSSLNPEDITELDLND